MFPHPFNQLLLLALTISLPLMALAEDKPENLKLTPYQEAFVAFKSGKNADALQLTNNLLNANPTDSAVLLLKGRILIKESRFKEAQDFLFMASEKNPKLDEVHFQLGEAAFGLEKWGEAVQYYRVYLSKVPGAADAVLKVIYCYLAAGDLHNSSRLITSLDPADDLHPCYYFARAALAFAANKHAEYQEALQQARTIYGNDVYGDYEPDFLFILKKINPVISGK